MEVTKTLGKSTVVRTHSTNVNITTHSVGLRRFKAYLHTLDRPKLVLTDSSVSQSSLEQGYIRLFLPHFL